MFGKRSPRERIDLGRDEMRWKVPVMSVEGKFFRRENDFLSRKVEKWYPDA